MLTRQTRSQLAKTPVLADQLPGKATITHWPTAPVARPDLNLPKRARGLSRGDLIRALIGLGTSTLFLWLAIRGVDLNRVGANIAQANVLLMVIGVGFGALDFGARSLRYSVLVRPTDPPTLRRMFPTLMVGFAANNLLPGRPGDLLRAYLASKQNGLSKGTTLAALAVERLLDVATLVAFVAVASLSFRLSDSIVSGAWITGVLAAALLVTLWLASRYHTSTTRLVQQCCRFLPGRIGDRVIQGSTSILRGLETMRSGQTLLRAGGLSLAAWGMSAISVYCFLLAFDQTVFPLVALLIIGISGVLGAVPSAPGNFGTMHLAFVLALGLLSVNQDTALGVGIAYHGLGYLWVTVVGLGSAWRKGVLGLSRRAMPW